MKALNNKNLILNMIDNHNLITQCELFLTHIFHNFHELGLLFANNLLTISI